MNHAFRDIVFGEEHPESDVDLKKLPTFLCATRKARQQEVVRNAGTDPAADLRQQEEKGALSPRSLYQKNKIAREQLSLQLLMHLNGEQMASIKASAFAMGELPRQTSLSRHTACSPRAVVCDLQGRLVHQVGEEPPLFFIFLGCSLCMKVETCGHGPRRKDRPCFCIQTVTTGCSVLRSRLIKGLISTTRHDINTSGIHVRTL